MISQDSQTATLTVEVLQEQSTEGVLLGAIARSALEEAIAYVDQKVKEGKVANREGYEC